MLYGILSGCRHGVHRIEDVLTITEERLEVSYACVVLPHTRVSSLFVGGHRDPIAIAL